MSNIKNSNDESFQIQEKVYTRWILSELQGASNTNFSDITKDLSNGVALIELAQVLTHKKAPQDWEQQPTSAAQNIKNCKLAFKMFRNDGFKAIGITSKDICDNDEKQILELIWQLILHYSIEKSFGNLNSKVNISQANVKNQLLSWAIKRTQNYKRVFAFNPYDLAMCALLDSYYPNKINYYVLDYKDHQKNFKLIMDVMTELKIPCLIYPEDVLFNNNQADKKILLAQLALVKINLEANKKLKEKRRESSRIQIKANPGNIIRESPVRKLDMSQGRLHQTKAANQNRQKTDLGVKKNKKSATVSRIPEKVKKNIDFNQDMKPDQLRKEIQKFKERNNKNLVSEDFSDNEQQEEQKVENDIIEDFNEDKKLYKERKEEEKKEKSKEKKKEKPIEKQIAEDFKENKEIYKERKEEENVNSKSLRLTIEKQDIEAQIADEFRGNEEAFNNRRVEDKEEEKKLEIEEEKREGLKPVNDRRPQFVNIV